MIWDNFAIFRTNCAIACGTRAYMLRGFLRISRGEMASEIPEIFHVLGAQLNAFTSVGILRKYFRRKLLQFEWSKTVSNLGMFCFKLIYIADQVVFRCFFYMSCTLLHFKFHKCCGLTAFPWQQKTSWTYQTYCPRTWTFAVISVQASAGIICLYCACALVYPWDWGIISNVNNT